MSKLLTIDEPKFSDKSTAEEHIVWCKWRAMRALKNEDLYNVATTLIMDLMKHEETMDHAAIMVCCELVMSGKMTLEKMRQFIEALR